MIKSIFIFLFTFAVSFHGTVVYAASYDEDVLDIFSKLLPRFVLMSSVQKEVKDKIEICLLYDRVDERAASSLREKIARNYPSEIKNYKIKPIEISYANIDGCRNSQLMFLFDTDEKNIEKAIHFSSKNSIFTISYDAKYLEKGVNASLFLGRKVTPYLNMNAIRNNGIELDNTLVRISKIYAGGNGE